MTIQKLEIHSSAIQLPDDKLSIFDERLYSIESLNLFAPHLPLDVLIKHGLGLPAAKTFLKRYGDYDHDVANGYIAYISSQKKKLLPIVLENDQAVIIQKLIDAKKLQ